MLKRSFLLVLSFLFVGIVAAQAAPVVATNAYAAPFPMVTPGGSTPHYLQVPFSLGPGFQTGAITVPVTNTPIHMMVEVRSPGTRGIGEVTIQRIKPNHFLEWVGIDISSQRSGPATISHGYSSAAGTHIIYADYEALVDVQVANANQIQVVNNQSSHQAGVITFIW